MKGQLKELLTSYGPIGILWFDGEWESPWTHERGVDLYQYVRSLQPSILVNNRVGKARAGMSGMDSGKDRILMDTTEYGYSSMGSTTTTLPSIEGRCSGPPTWRRATHAGFAEAELAFKSFVSDPARLAAVRDRVAALEAGSA